MVLLLLKFIIFLVSHIVNFSEPLYAEPLDHYDSFEYDITPLETQNPSNIQISNLLRTNHRNDEERKSLIKLCDEFHMKPDDKLTFTITMKHGIKSKDEEAVYTKSYHYPHVHKEEIRKQIMHMLNEGIIKPISSPWSSPIWIVLNKMDASG